MSDLTSDDYYKVLGVPRDANEKQIKNAYRKLAIKWHPDKNQDKKDLAEKNFKLVGEAYSVLSDPKQRQVYDQVGKAGLQGGGGGAGGFPGGAQFHNIDPNEIFAQFFGNNDPFAAFFGGDMGQGMGGGGPFMFQQQGGGFPGGGAGGFQMGGGFPMGGRPGMGHPGMMHPGMQQQQQQRRRQQPNTLAPGTRVLIKGLRQAEEWNGTYGEIQGYDPSKGRYQVLALEERNVLALRWENIQQHVSGVTLTGIQSRPELNNQRGDLIDFDVEKHRAYIRIASSRTCISFKPDNVILPSGTVVQIVGLAKSPAHNGRFGTIESVDLAAGRYVLKLGPSQTLKIRFANVKP